MPITKTANRTRKLFLWLDQVKADAELLPVAFTVAYEIGQHFNHRHGGAAWPSSLTIATNIGVDKATVIRAVRQLRERGHLKVDPGKAGRGHSNRYRMAKPPRIKGAAAHPLERIKGASEPRKGAPAHLNHLEPPMADVTTSAKRERESGSHALTDDPGALAEGGAWEGSKDRFAELLSIWQRPWGEDDTDACLAFALVCRDADPDDIIASARRWVAAVEPRFLKPLTKWLGRGLWKNQPPPPKPKRDSGKASLAETMRRQGEQS